MARSLLRRLRHQPIRTFGAGFSWSKPDTVEVPAGRFEVRGLEWTRADGVSCTVSVEVPSPHRVIKWACADGELAELTGSMRTPYWQRVSARDERLLKVLGLPRGGRE